MLPLLGIGRERWGLSEEFKPPTADMRGGSEAVSVAGGEAGKDRVPRTDTGQRSCPGC